MMWIVEICVLVLLEFLYENFFVEIIFYIFVLDRIFEIFLYDD